jgi:ferrochelatase
MANKALLLANLGSPDSTEVSDVRKYLDEFLMDGRVIDVPYFLRFLLVKGIIVPFRAPKSAAKYKTIWTTNGSPLIHITKQLTQLVAEYANMPAYMCMRYANPTPKFALDLALRENPDLEELIMVPLYPHYAMSSYETAVVHVHYAHRAGKYPFALKVVPPYYEHEAYLAALAESISPFLNQTYDHLLFSYHGVPERHLRKTDPTGSYCLSNEMCCEMPSEVHNFCYRHQVKTTTERIAAILDIPKEKYSFSFQSRLGSDKWLKPYTAEQLKSFPKAGIKNLLVVCPAFVSDCLETLEEINTEGREDFLHAGGENFTFIPCLNTREQWVAAIGHLAQTAQ